MKKLFCLFSICLLLAACIFPAQAEEMTNTTVMIYMCGSNLESMNGAASSDIMEMLAAGYSKEDVQVVLMTGGAESWNGVGVNPSSTAVYEITKRGGLRCRWDESLLNMGESETLSFFLNYAAENYPAQRYALIMWDHGGGPLSGVCWDEIASDHLTLDEVTQALDASPFAHNPLEWIGFDACLMASAEVAWQMAPYARYMVASEETEPARGWNYSFLSGLEQDADGAATGKRIIESYMAGAQGNDTLTLSCIDLSKIDGLRASMSQYFDFLGQSLTEETFSRHSKMRHSTESFGESILRAVTDTVTGDYDLVDLGHLLKQNTDDSWMQKKALDALESTVVASASTEEGHHGLSVYFPLKNKATYEKKWGEEYSELNFSDGYTGYVRKFGQILTQDALTDWTASFAVEALEHADGSGIQLALQLTPEQRDHLAAVRLVALGKEAYGVYYRTYISPALTVDENGRLEADYSWETLHAVDAVDGHIMTPSIDFYVTDSGEYAVMAAARKSMAEDAYELPLILLYERIPGSTRLQYKGVQVYDEQTQTYSGRLSFDLAAYPYIAFVRSCRTQYSSNEEEHPVWPGFDSWPEYDRIRQSYVISTENAFHLEFAADNSDQPVVCFEITDTQNNVYLIHAAERNEMLSLMNMEGYLAHDPYMTLFADALMMDESGIYLSLSTVNNSPRTFENAHNQHYFFSPMINGVPCRFADGAYSIWTTEPETLSGKVLHLEWPEGVTLENAYSLAFRVLYAYPEGLYDYASHGAEHVMVSEYGQLTWDPALTTGRSAVSMSASCFTVLGDLYAFKPEELAILEQEILFSRIENSPSDALVLPVPQAVRGAENGCIAAGRWETDADGHSVFRPLWLVYTEAQDEQFCLPAGYLSIETGEENIPLLAALSADGKHAVLAGEILFRLAGGLGNSKINEIHLNLSLGTVVGMDRYGSAVPVALTEEVTVMVPALDGYSETHFVPSSMPLQLEMCDLSEEDIVLVYCTADENGEWTVLGEETPAPNTVRTELHDGQTHPAPCLYVDEEGWRWVRCGDFLVSFEQGEVTVVGYVGTEETAVVPDTINGLPVTNVIITYTNATLKQLTLPSTLLTRTESTEEPLNEYACLRLDGLTGLETVIVPDCETLRQVPLKHFFLGRRWVPRIPGTDELPYTYSTAKRVVRGAEELWFDEGLCYILNEEGRAVITDHEIVHGRWFDYEEGTLRIPAQLNGVPVAGIGENAFLGDRHFQRLVVEEGVQWIGDRAFADTSIQETVLPASVLFVGENAFPAPAETELSAQETEEAEALPAVTSGFCGPSIQWHWNEDGTLYLNGSGATYDFYIPNPNPRIQAITITEGEAQPWEKLNDRIYRVVIGEGITSIGKKAFENCKALTSLVLPEGLISIAEDAFSYCSGLTALTLPESLQTIGLDAFYGCKALQTLRFPQRLETIGQNAFTYCESLVSITFSENADADAAIPLNIDDMAFYGCASLETIGFPQRLKRIGDFAFFGCPSLTALDLPVGLNVIGDSAFRGCSGLTSVVIPDGTRYLGHFAFADCLNVTQIDIPASTTEIGINLFWNTDYFDFNASADAFIRSPNYDYLLFIVDEGSPAHEYAELYGLHYEFR